MPRLILFFALLVLASCQNALLFHPDVDMRAWDASPLRQHPRLQELHFQAADGIKLQKVKLGWSAFRREEAPRGNRTYEREFGVLQLEVSLTMQTTFAVMKQTRRVRRYVALEPNPPDKGARFRVYPANLMSEVSGS